MKLAKKIIGTAVTVAILIFVGIMIWDYINFTGEKEMKFCLEEGRTEARGFDYVEYCNGFGYKAFIYYTNGNVSRKAFGPFWIQIQEDTE